MAIGVQNAGDSALSSCPSRQKSESIMNERVIDPVVCTAIFHQDHRSYLLWTLRMITLHNYDNMIHHLLLMPVSATCKNVACEATELCPALGANISSSDSQPVTPRSPPSAHYICTLCKGAT